LIKLSPKKTWEGFIGGALFTILFGWFISGFLAQFSYLTCPSEVKPNLSVNLDCEPSVIFSSQTYTVPLFIKVLFKPLLIDLQTIDLIPFQLHCLAFSIFASSIAPFGGFFASGFKRAFKIKDFSDTIPGHGGVVDRFDCQILMATFVNVYLSTFIRLPSTAKLFQSITMMSTADQISLFSDLHQHLASQGLIPWSFSFLYRCRILLLYITHHHKRHYNIACNSATSQRTSLHYVCVLPPHTHQLWLYAQDFNENIICQLAQILFDITSLSRVQRNVYWRNTR